MAAINTAKKTNFLVALLNNAVALKQQRDVLKLLAEQWSKDAVLSGITDADCAASGGTQHLTATIVANYLTAFQPNLELILAGTTCTPGAPYLPNILAVIPQ
jgi:hypothetical protein